MIRNLRCIPKPNNIFASKYTPQIYTLFNPYCIQNNKLDIKNLYYFSTKTPKSKTPQQQFIIKKQLLTNKNIIQLLDIFQKYHKEEKLTMIHFGTFLNSVAKISINYQIPTDQYNYNRLLSTMVMILQQFNEVLKINSLHNNTYILFLNFLAMENCITLYDSNSNKLSKLVCSEVVLKSFNSKFQSLSLKGKSYIIKIFNLYRNDIINTHGQQYTKKYQISMKNHINNTLAYLQNSNSSSVDELVYFWRDCVKFSEINKPPNSQIQRSYAQFLSQIYKKMADMKTKFLYLFLKTTSRWIIQHIQIIDLSIVWKQAQISQILKDNVMNVSKAQFNQQTKNIQCLAIAINMMHLYKNMRIPKNTTVQKNLHLATKLAFKNLHSYLKQKINDQKLKQQGIKIGVIQEFETTQDIQNESDIEIEGSLNLPKNISLSSINILLEAMQATNYIDQDLYIIIDKIFFNFLGYGNSKQKDILIYLNLHNKLSKSLVKTIRSEVNENAQKQLTQQKVISVQIRSRNIKKSHISFILRVIDNLKKNSNISVGGFINIMQNLQNNGLKVKSRKIKRQLILVKESWESGAKTSKIKGLKDNQKILINLIIQNF